MENQKKRRLWTAEEEKLLTESVQKRNGSLNTALVVVAEQIDRTPAAVLQKYAALKNKGNNDTEEHRTSTKWTEREEQTLVAEIKKHPSNIKQCCQAVAGRINRSPTGVAAHWYSKTSRRPDVKCFFTASSKHVAMNRKNGEGIPSNSSVWVRMLRALRSIGLQEKFLSHIIITSFQR